MASNGWGVLMVITHTSLKATASKRAGSQVDSCLMTNSEAADARSPKSSGLNLIDSRLNITYMVLILSR